MRTAYTYQLKSIECTQCGAPVVAPPDAGQQNCGYCGTLLVLRPRRKEVDQHPEIDESSRMHGLRAQAGRQDPNSPVLYRAPQGLESFAAMLTRPEARKAGLAGIRQDWEATRAKLQVDSDREESIRLFRLALLLSQFYTAENDDAHARAVVETALDLCVDSGQRDILRCALARAALDAGDEDAFNQWLSDCNPRPVQLEVDSHLRCTHSRLHVRRGNYDRVLELLGQHQGQVPLSQDMTFLARIYRAHAFAGLGNEARSRAEIREIARSVSDPVESIRLGFSKNPGPAQPYADDAIRARPAAVSSGGGSGKNDGPTPAQKAFRRIGCLIFTTTVLPLLFTCIIPVMPILMVDCDGSREPFDQAVARIEACPQAKAALGQDIDWSLGFSCGNCEMSNGSGSMNWSTPVSGTNGSGRLDFSATRAGGTWTLWSATLDVDGQVIDLMSCTGGATAPGFTTSTTTTTSIETVTGGGGFVGSLTQQCDGGDAVACLSLGAMYEHGNGAPQDLGQARARYQQACDLGQSGGCMMVQQLGGN